MTIQLNYTLTTVQTPYKLGDMESACPTSLAKARAARTANAHRLSDAVNAHNEALTAHQLRLVVGLDIHDGERWVASVSDADGDIVGIGDGDCPEAACHEAMWEALGELAHIAAQG